MSKPTSNPLLLPSNGVIAGENIAQWTEDWWTWQVQAQAATNPLLDTTGTYADLNNDGSIFFLAGSLAQNDVITRDFSVPHDTPLLAPVMTFLALQYIGTGPDPKDPATGTAAAANQQLHAWEKNIDNLFLKIDGVAVPDLANDLVKTGFFAWDRPNQGLWLRQSVSAATFHIRSPRVSLQC